MKVRCRRVGPVRRANALPQVAKHYVQRLWSIVAAARGCIAHTVAAGSYDLVVYGVGALLVDGTTAGRVQDLIAIVVKDAASCLDLIVVVGQGLASALVSGRKVSTVAASQKAGARVPLLGRVS